MFEAMMLGIDIRSAISIEKTTSTQAFGCCDPQACLSPAAGPIGLPHVDFGQIPIL
jgi:hypothetical protein